MVEFDEEGVAPAAWPQWKLAGVKAVLALSPYSQPFIAHGTLGDLAVPVMYQGGTRDFGITPALEKAVDKAAHFAWTDIGRSAFREPIVDYGVAFMNRYVRGGPDEPLLSQAAPGISLLRHPARP